MTQLDTGRLDTARLGRTAAWLAAFYLVASAATAIFAIAAAGDTRVFGSFWASGDAWLKGLDPFAAQPGTWIVRIPGPNIVDVNLNPPVTLPLMGLFALGPPLHMAVAWIVISLAITAACYFVIIREANVGPFVLAWGLSCAALVDTLMLGQIYLLLLLLGTAIWMGLRRSWPAMAWLALGALVAVKPNFALALPVLFVAGHRRIAMAAGATAGLLTLGSLVAFGPATFADWIAAVRADDHSMFPTTVSVISYFARLGLPRTGMLAAGCVTVALLAWAFRTKPGVEALRHWG